MLVCLVADVGKVGKLTRQKQRMQMQMLESSKSIMKHKVVFLKCSSCSNNLRITWLPSATTMQILKQTTITDRKIMIKNKEIETKIIRTTENDIE